MDQLTAPRAAHKLTRILNTFAAAHGASRFPVDVESLALEAATFFDWNDPIAEVRAASIPSFEGALFANEARSKWLLLYNDELRSEGRIRFTQAHELGHYILHRATRDAFQCSSGDMIDIASDEKTIESQADVFACNLLMPLDDFRSQMLGASNLEALGAVASRYGVSLTSAALRWIEHTDACAMLLVHRDGFVDWWKSSRSAKAAGATLFGRPTPIAVPSRSLAADDAITQERLGREISARVWFPHADAALSLQEMKISADQYDFVMTLLVLPRGSKVWQPKRWERDTGPVADARDKARNLAGR